ncbi:MAG: hypothetical protein F6K26_26625 [Moorea sp. SIO2I5]|nr:hypothetical protein [Moorena sp. SIO2I5]
MKRFEEHNYCLDAVAHGGNPQDRNGAFSALRIKFATGRTSASLFFESGTSNKPDNKPDNKA